MAWETDKGFSKIGKKSEKHKVGEEWQEQEMCIFIRRAGIEAAGSAVVLLDWEPVFLGALGR